VEKIKQQEINRKEYSTVNIHDQDNFLRGKREGISQGEYQKAIETATNFLQMGISVEQVVQGTGLSFEVINELKSQLSRT
jgi:predicted transposase/invertase (TIGR01784 family)